MNAFLAWPKGRGLMKAVDPDCDSDAPSRQLLELARLWVSLRNGCDYCVAMHRHEAATEGADTAALDRMIETGATDQFTPSERAVLDLAGLMTTPADKGTIARGVDAARAHFTDGEVGAIVHAVCMINAWNRLVMASGMSVADFKPR